MVTNTLSPPTKDISSIIKKGHVSSKENEKKKRQPFGSIHCRVHEKKKTQPCGSIRCRVHTMGMSSNKNKMNTEDTEAWGNFFLTEKAWGNCYVIPFSWQNYLGTWETWQSQIMNQPYYYTKLQSMSHSHYIMSKFH